MLSITQNLALHMVQSIQRKQNWFTHPSRKRALAHIHRHLNSQELSLSTIITQARNQVNESGRGLKNSYFLKATETFLAQMTHLQATKPELWGEHTTETTIRSLATRLVTHMGSRYNTYSPFQACVNDPKQSINQIIENAIQHRNQIQQSHRYAFWNWRKNNKIIEEIDFFISQARFLVAHTPHLANEESPNEVHEEIIKESKQEIETPLVIRSPNSSHEVILKDLLSSEEKSLLREKQQIISRENNEAVFKKFKVRSFKELNEKRITLEEEITKLFHTHFKKPTPITRAWDHRLNVQVSPDDVCNYLFFTNHTKEIKALPLDLKSKLEDYEAIIRENRYKDYLQTELLKKEEQVRENDRPKAKLDQSVEKAVDKKPTTVQTHSRNLEEYTARQNQKYQDNQSTVAEKLRALEAEYPEATKHKQTLDNYHQLIGDFILGKEQTNLKLKQAWQHHVIRLEQGEEENVAFFSYYQQELNAIPGLERLISRYKEMLLNVSYQNYLSQVSLIKNMPVKNIANQEKAANEMDVQECSPQKEKLEKNSKGHQNKKPKPKEIKKPQFTRSVEENWRKQLLEKYEEEHFGFMLQNANRLKLEKKIGKLLHKHHSHSPAPYVWQSTMYEPYQLPKDMSFFERFETQVSTPRKLQKLVTQYKTAISDPDLVDYLKTRAVIAEASKEDLIKKNLLPPPPEPPKEKNLLENYLYLTFLENPQKKIEQASQKIRRFVRHSR